MTKIIFSLLLSCLPIMASAGYYDGVDSWAVTSDTTTRTVSGGFAVAASTKTWRNFVTRIDGTHGITSSLQISASSGTFGGLRFTGPCTVGYRLTAVDNDGNMACQPPASSVSADYYFSRDVFPVTKYNVMYTSAQVSSAISTRTFATIGATPVIVSTFASLNGYPGITVQPGGAYTIDFRAARTAGNANQSLYMYATIYRYTTGGAEIPIFIAPTTLISGSAPTQYLVTGTTIAFAMDSTDRFLLRTYAFSAGSGSPLPTLQLYSGNGYSTKLTVPQAAANVGTYVPWTGGQYDLDLNTHKITASSAVINGPLTASSATLTGNAFSVGGSTLVVAQGNVTIGNSLALGGSAITAGYTLSGGNITMQTSTPLLNFDDNAQQDWNIKTGDGNMHVTGAAEYLTFQNTTGNVGIGTASPSAKLHISSGSVYNDGTGAGMYTTGTSSAAAVYASGNITAGGDVYATYLHGNGAGITGLPGGGDAVLAATQTWTGSNNFSNISATTTFAGKVIISTYSAATNGFTYLPGGILFQWGSISIEANSTATSSFPKTFSAACYSLTAVHGPQGSWQGYGGYITGPGGVNIVSTSQFQISNLDDSTVTYYWQAIGY